MRHIWICLIICIGLIGWVSADEVEIDYPLVEMLEQTQISAFDPIVFAQQTRGFDPAILDGWHFVPAEELGTIQSFWARGKTDSIFSLDAELRVMGEHIFVWVEVGKEIDQDYLVEVSNTFDEKIYPLSQEIWGDIPELDVPIYVLFASNMIDQVIGYFSHQMLYPVEVVPTSNQYPMVFINLDYHFQNIDTITPLLAHEYQHLVNFYLNTQQDTWLNEGYSSFFESLLGYDRMSFLAPRFFAGTDSQLNFFGTLDTISTLSYSKGFMFLTYFYQRYGLEGIRAHYPTIGLSGFTEALQQLEPTITVDDLFADWVIANYLYQDETWGYKMDMPDRSIFRIHPLTTEAEYTLPQYGSHYFSIRPESDIQIHIDFNESVRLIPTDAPSGDYVWFSNIADRSTTTLTRAFDLREVDNATLSFDVWYDLESYRDYIYLLISTDAGQTWDFLQTTLMTDENPVNNAYGTGWTDSSDGWQRDSVSLADYAGQEVMVRFQYVTDDTLQGYGMAIDNFTIPEINYASDLEADDGGWMADGWLRMDNRLPQRAWIQAVLHGTGRSVIDVQRWMYPDETEFIFKQDEAIRQIILVVSPIAPKTIIPAHYRISVEALESE